MHRADHSCGESQWAQEGPPRDSPQSPACQERAGHGRLGQLTVQHAIEQGCRIKWRVRRLGGVQVLQDGGDASDGEDGCFSWSPPMLFSALLQHRESSEPPSPFGAT